MPPQIELSVLVPCFNESGNLPELTRRTGESLGALGIEFELVLVDDGSADGTYSVAQSLREKAPWIVPVRHEKNMGMTEGWASALKASRGQYVLTIDADLQYRPEDIPAMWKKIKDEQTDLVQGMRASNPSGSRMRRIFSRMFSVMLNVIFNTGLKDVKSGFILYRRAVFEDIIEDRVHFRYFQHFPTVAAKARGYSMAEVPVVFDRRYSGESFIKNAVSFGLKALVDLPKALRMYGRGRS